jgi:hypothetical protein
MSRRVPDSAHRAQDRLFKSETTDQYGHYDLRGIPPGDYKLVQLGEAEAGSWEDPEFLKPFEDKGEKITLQESDQETQNLTTIQTKTPEPINP